MSDYSKVPARVPDVEKLATAIINHVDHMAFLLNNEAEVKKSIIKGINLGLVMTIKACAKKAQDYDPIGFKEIDEAKKEIKDSILELLK